MFQRLKGAIDARIAEEQARQRIGGDSPSSRSNSIPRDASRTGSPSKRPARTRDRDKPPSNAVSRGPDPAEFEAAFVIEDDDAPSRAGTPGPERTRPQDQVADEVPPETITQPPAPSDDGVRRSGSSSTGPVQVELPTDVRVKLRKLDRFEGKYQDLLKSYRIAHARVLSIEPFETSLRENTPLTSISDPGALIEYLNQLNLRGDMVMDELKRVTADRDSLKDRVEEAERKSTDALRDQSQLSEGGTSAGTTSLSPTAAQHNDNARFASPNNTEDTNQTVITAPSQPLLDQVAPKESKERQHEEVEDLFSYDEELSRLENELKAKDDEIDALNRDVKSLKADLAVTRESTEGMAQSLESATREVNTLREFKDSHDTSQQHQHSSLGREKSELLEKLGAAHQELERIKIEQSSLVNDAKKNEQLIVEIDALRSEVLPLQASKETYHQQVESLEATISEHRSQFQELSDSKDQLKATLEEKSSETAELVKRIAQIQQDADRASTLPQGQAQSPIAETKDGTGPPPQPAESLAGVGTSQTSKKSKKKKKKGTKGGPGPSEAPRTESEKQSENSGQGKEPLSSSLQSQVEALKKLLEEKERLIETLKAKANHSEDLQKEIDSLRDDLVNVGQDHVQAKEQIKELEADKHALEESLRNLEREFQETRDDSKSSSAGLIGKHDQLVSDFDDLKLKAGTLQTDLSAAQQLAASRFKDLTELRAILQKAQPELTSLRAEAAGFRSAREDLGKKTAELRKLEGREKDLRSEITGLRKRITDGEAEQKTLTEKCNQEANNRVKTQEEFDNSQRDLRNLEQGRQDAIESQNKTAKELSKVQEEATAMRAKMRTLDQQVAKLVTDTNGLREEIELKTAQHASAQSLMGSMRDQTSEMAMQMKEARERCDSLEEELADAHRLLSERSREGETMRRLLADVEARAEHKVREMRERMETAIEERDRAEDEASTIGRRRAREVEELKAKVRDAERLLKRIREDKEELEKAEVNWRKRREELESKAISSTQEVDELRNAMVQLRDTLDENEKQTREVEKQKAELRRAVEETQQRLERLQKSNKAMGEELRTFKAAKARTLGSEGPSSRSSLEASPSRANMSSPAANGTGRGRNSSVQGSDEPAKPNEGTVDFVYLKNVLLQFLEQRDRKHQMQLVPVLGMLLHFDRKDEQKWMAAITAK
ncbi:MAG: hypothetical protein M1833_001196 [Piccolia ochrophora]|nr:MAG: hypothetical protein M1833_001196 [Piccolia ochrophora]